MAAPTARRTRRHEAGQQQTALTGPWLPRRLHAGGLLVAMMVATAAPGRAAQAPDAGAQAASAAFLDQLPVVAEHSYRMAGRIRPLVFFWIGRDDVGGGRITWRQGSDGTTAFELLIGSDPARAPRRLNRWGYIAERVSPLQATLLGVMKQSKEESLEEAKSKLAQESLGATHVFKAIRSAVRAASAEATVATIEVADDFTYLDAPALLGLVERDAGHLKTTHTRLPQGTKPGFLVTVADLVHRSVQAVHGGSVDRAVPRRDTAVYVYNDTLYDLTMSRAERLRTFEAADQVFTNVLRAEFDTRNRTTGKSTHFELVYGTEGALAEVPIRIRYRPRWWLEAELILDDSLRF